MADLAHDTRLTPDPVRPGRFDATVGGAWRIFYAFGGVTMAVAWSACRQHLDRPDLDPVSASALFCAPVPPGPVQVDVDVLRDGRTAAQVAADLRVDDCDEVALRLHSTFGARASTDMAFQRLAFPAEAGQPLDWDPPPKRADDDPFSDVPFHDQTEWRMAVGTRPWDDDPAAGPAVAGAWTRLLEPAFAEDGTIDPLAVIVHADSIGTAISQAFGARDPWLLLSLEISLRFVASAPTPWLYQDMRGWEAADGYASGETRLWGEDRRLVAVATQTARVRPMSQG